MRKVTIAALLVSALTINSALAEEVTLKGIAALPATTDFTKRFLAFVDVVNKNGKGVVQINVVGGPEAIPPQQQDTALRNGVVDIQGGPAAYYSGTVPESAAIKGATITVAEARKNGAWDYLSGVWKERLNAKLLGWIGGGVQFYTFHREEPVFSANGDLDLTGKKLRSAPTYRDWFDSMGAGNVMLKVSEIYTSVERGVVDGFGAPIFATDLGTNKLLNSRVGPGVWQNDVVIMANGDKWASLSDEAKKIVQDAALQIEHDNLEYYSRRIVEENKQLQVDGVKLIEISGDAGLRHVKKAHDLVWDKLKTDAPEAAEKLKPLMYSAK